jgi:hypothetical protein
MEEQGSGKNPGTLNFLTEKTRLVEVLFQKVLDKFWDRAVLHQIIT